MRAFLISYLFLWGLGSAWAELRVSWIFQDRAVLQRDMPVPVWGEANCGQRVLVSYREQVLEAVADSAGRWRVQLPPMRAHSEGSTLEVRTAEERLVFDDVVVGDVWLCAGQSNMEWSVGRAAEAETEIPAANHPQIRHIKVANFSSRTPVTSAKGTWRVCSPETVRHFSAVGYYFAREISQHQNVPVGIINCTWGGTPIEAWISERALLSHEAFDVVFTRWSEAIATFPERSRAFARWTEKKRTTEERGEAFTRARPRDPSIDYRRQPAGLWGGMVAPLSNFAVRGIAWYHGEENASRADEYRALLSAWITDWRLAWPNAPVLLVQLPNYAAGNANGTSWARLREAQARVAQEVDGVILVTTIDLGDPSNVHPLDKKSVGRRVALASRETIYGESLSGRAPTFKTMRKEGEALLLSFAHADGLTVSKQSIGEFQVAGEDRKFHQADVRIVGDVIRLTSSHVSDPIAARYAWRNAPEVTVFNAAGFPLVPFRTDAWTAYEVKEKL
jgi:sialate O-acetylesterase